MGCETEPRRVSDWKPCTIMTGAPMYVSISGGDDHDRKSLGELVAVMLRETKLAGFVLVTVPVT